MGVGARRGARCAIISLGLLLAASQAGAETTPDAPPDAAPPDAATIRAAGAGVRAEAMALFRDFLAQANDAHDRAAIDALVDWMTPAFEARGFEVRDIPTDGAPALFAKRDVPGAAATALIYLQADGQPVDPAHWDQPDPYTAVLKRPAEGGGFEVVDWPADLGAIDEDHRVFARSASDSKGPMTQFMAAIDAMDAAGLQPAYNLKVIIDTEEELGSPNLAPAIEAHRDLLAADFLLIFDGPPHASNRPTVAFGARGVTTVTLTTYGPLKPQHSGHYGNFVPNPAFRLARLLASMKDEDGRVVIDGYYDDITIDDETRAILAATPDDETAILSSMGLAAPDKVAGSLQEAIQHPSLNIRGLRAAWVGAEARTIIPSSAVAELDIRTVKETDPERLVALVRDHIENEGYHVLDRPPTAEERRAHERLVSMTHEVAYNAFRSPFDSSPGRVARGGLERLYGEAPILIRSHGGSIPIAPLVDTLGLEAAIAPTVNIDNNQHSPNENIRVGNFYEGIDMLIAVLTTPPATPATVR